MGTGMATLSRLFGVAFLVASCAPLFAQDRAQQILAQARQAVGGEARLKAVRTLSVKGTIEPDLPSAWRVANLQIDFALPDRFLVSRDWPGAFFRRIGGFDGEELIEQRQLSLKWTDMVPDGGKQAVAWQLAARRRECARYLVAWLLMAPEPYGIRFTHGGDGVAAARPADVLDATGAHDFAARLLFDKVTHRLVDLSYRERLPNADPAAEPKAPAGAQPMFKAIEKPKSEPDKVMLHFDDYHADGGIVFPHRIRVETEGTGEVWKISRFRVNPDIDPRQFKKR